MNNTRLESFTITKPLFSFFLTHVVHYFGTFSIHWDKGTRTSVWFTRIVWNALHCWYNFVLGMSNKKTMRAGEDSGPSDSEGRDKEEEYIVNEYLKSQKQIDALKTNGTVAWLNSIVAFAFRGVQFIGWSCVAYLLIRLVGMTWGTPGLLFKRTYETTSRMVTSLQQFACLEILLSIFGISESPVLGTMFSLAARNVVVLMTLQHSTNERVRESPAVLVAFSALTISEILRCAAFLGNSKLRACCPGTCLRNLHLRSFAILFPLSAMGEWWVMKNAMGLSRELRTIPDLGQGWSFSFPLSYFISSVYFPICLPGYAVVYAYKMGCCKKSSSSSSSENKVKRE